MPLDMNQFIETFHEECLEALEEMETGLLELDSMEAESINSLFRAAHSIKGGAGTLGFTALSSFTHNVETLLDAIRKESHPADRETADLLLQACDCIRSLLFASRNNTPVDNEKINTISDRLEESVDSLRTNIPSLSTDDESFTNTNNAYTRWLINFAPHKDMLTYGNDPLPLFEALAELGKLSLKINTDKLPLIEELVPESIYLSWTLELHGNIRYADIEEIFEWISDDCELNITPFDKTNSSLALSNHDETYSEIDANDGTVESSSFSRESSSDGKRKSIRVNTSKIDQLINRVGELVITQSMLQQIGNELEEGFYINNKITDRLREGLEQLERHTRDLQEGVRDIRMVPISFAFNRLPRLVHELSQRLNKQINLKIHGEDTEIDKTLIEYLSDPLLHLLRNAVDHGIEPPDERIQKGKPPTGTITIEAGHRGGNVVIEMRDDGRGMGVQAMRDKALERGFIESDAGLTDKQIHELIFEPGFSTAGEISDLSGRGVGMDVVRNNIRTLGGDVEFDTKVDVGTSFRIILPLTLAILDGQTIKVGTDLYVIPLATILESIQVREKDIRRPADAIELFQWRNEQLPLIRLHTLLDIPRDPHDEDRGLVVIVEGGGYRAGLTVSDLLAQQQFVIKSLDENFLKVDGFSGATILGDGSIALILDIGGIIKLAREKSSANTQIPVEVNYAYN